MRKIWRVLSSLVSVLVLVGVPLMQRAWAIDCPQGMSQMDCAAINGGWVNWVPDNGIGSCGSSSSFIGTGSGDSELHLTATQVSIVKTIVGIAKTENLGPGGALIGLMVAEDESGFHIYASSNVPISQQNPVWLALPKEDQLTGSDHMSVGVFQQQVGYDWTTLSPDSASNSAAVFQLMDPAYSAEAFFGSPAGAKAPPALSKGLQNQPGWQAMDPWVAAQAVQQSGTLDGSNYKAYLSDAKQLIAKYYDSSPAIPLPVAFDGAGSGTPSINGGCSGTSSYNCTSPSTTAKILCEAQRYSGIWYHWGGGHQGYTAYVASCPDPTNPPDNQAHGAPIDANGQSGNPSPCGVDCSGLVSLAVDGAFHQTFSWTVNDLEHDTVNWAPISINQAQPGDVVTHNDSGGIGEHVEIFVSYNASSGTVTSFGAHDTGTQTGQVTSSASYYNGGAYHYIGPTN